MASAFTIAGNRWKFQSIEGRQYLDNGNGPEEFIAIVHADRFVVMVADSAPLERQLAAAAKAALKIPKLDVRRYVAAKRAKRRRKGGRNA